MKIMRTLIIIILLIIFLYIENSMLVVTKIQYKSYKVPESFNGFRIVHLSDLHGKEFGKNNRRLVSGIKSVKPDLIVITGDLINANYFDENSIVNVMIKIRQIAPVYYVTGNHEMANKNFNSLEQKLRRNGIKILRNSSDNIERNGDVIHLIGIDDPITTSMADSKFIREYLAKELDEVLGKNDINTFKILLSHRPEQFSLYAEHKIDLIFAGHAHGGQIRLPFIGGLVAPGQGLFPKYTSGKYLKENSTMIVSRGLGNGSIPQRLFNRPEIIVTTLSNSKETD